MPHKKSIPRSLHRARHEIGITFSFNLTPSLSPKKQVKSAQVQDLPIQGDVEAAAESIIKLSPNAVSTLSPPVSKSLAVPLGGGSMTATVLDPETSSATTSNQDDEYTDPISQTPVIEMARHIGSNDSEDMLITSYNLTPSIKTVSSITLMRRIQSHNPMFQRRNSHSSLSGSIRSKADKPGKKRRIAQVSAFLGECIWCGTHKTAQWRKGPIGARSLCNRCGIEWAKHIKNESKALSISMWEAEDLLIQQYKNGERFQQYRKFPGSPASDA